MRHPTTSVCLLALTLAACASGPSFHGDTVAGSQLRNDASAIVIGATMAQTNCRSVDSISTSVVSVPDAIVADPTGHIVGGGDVVEHWVASACGQTAAFVVTFTPDGQGGTFMSIEGQ